MIEDMLNEYWSTPDCALEELDVSILQDTHPFELMCQHKDYQPDQCHLLFVYGTMKAGYPNHHRISMRPGNEYMGFTTTRGGCYTMGTRTSKAGIVVPVVRDHGCHDIFGELYYVDGPTLFAIDLAEGHPETYVRRNTKVYFSGEVSVAHMYVFTHQFDLTLKHKNVSELQSIGGKPPTQEFILDE